MFDFDVKNRHESKLNVVKVVLYQHRPQGLTTKVLRTYDQD